jgi:hypothetical protein
MDACGPNASDRCLFPRARARRIWRRSRPAAISVSVVGGKGGRGAGGELGGGGAAVGFGMSDAIGLRRKVTCCFLLMS